VRVGLGQCDGHGEAAGDVTDRDAEKSGKTATELAKEILGHIQTAVSDYRIERRWKTYGLGVAFIMLSIIGLLLALHLNNKAFAWLSVKVTGMKDFWESGVYNKIVKMLSAEG
jgi:hypothetical protein